MIENTPEARAKLAALRQVILDLSLIAQGPSASFDPAPPPDDLKRAQRYRTKAHQPIVPHLGSHSHFEAGSTLPGFDTGRADDRHFDYRQKSDRYFRNRLVRWENDSKRTYGVSDLERLLKEAKDALRDWRITPSVAGVQNDRNTFLWKCEVADAKGDIEDVCRKFGVSRRTLGRYREQFQGVRKRAA